MQYILLPVNVVATTKQLELNTSKQMVLTYLRGVDLKWTLKNFTVKLILNIIAVPCIAT